MLNSRPLTQCENEVGATALTPNHFLTHTRPRFPLISNEQSNDPDYGPAAATTQSQLVTKWKRIQSVLDQFWTQWYTKYLAELRERGWCPKNRGASKLVPKVGSVVLIKEDLLPRGRWKIATIVSLDRSFDGNCRSATLKLPNGTQLRRALKQLYPVEVPEDDPPTPPDDGTRASAPDVFTRRQRPARVCAKKARTKIAAQMATELSGDE